MFNLRVSCYLYERNLSDKTVAIAKKLVFEILAGPLEVDKSMLQFAPRRFQGMLRPFILSAFSPIVSINPAFAESPTFPVAWELPGDLVRQETINSPRIVLCSDLETLGTDLVYRFAMEAFPESTAPEVLDGNNIVGENPDKGVFFYFGLANENGIDLKNEDCLETFPVLDQKYLDIFRSIAVNIGSPIKYTRTGDLYAPIQSSHRTFVEDGSVIFIYIALEGSNFPNVQTSLFKLFGLSLNFCDLNDNCPIFSE